MIKILLCCGGGFSSSAIAQKMSKDIEKLGLQEEAYVEFYPFTIANEKYHDFDIIMCCPHLKMYVMDFINRVNPDIPIYILPPKMYGMMNIEEILQDAKDIIDIYSTTKTNPVHFEGEDNVLRITRGIAHRNYHLK